jgi:archaellin
MPRADDTAVSAALGLIIVGASVVGGILVFGMLMSTTGSLAQKAASATDAATSGSDHALQIRSLSTQGGPAGIGVQRVMLLITPAIGSDGVDLRTLVVELASPSGRAVFSFENDPRFRWDGIYDADPPLSEAPVLGSSDVAEVALDLSEAGLLLKPREQATVLLLVPGAADERATFTVPLLPGGVAPLARR